MKRNGFTLLEMLVVLAVFGLLMLTVTEGMRFAGRASEIAGQSLAWTEQIEPADRSLRAMLEQIRPQGALETNPALVGSADTMSFQAEISDPSLELGHAQANVELAFEGGDRLAARTQPAPHATWIGPPAPVRSTVLVDRLAGGSFAYWDGAHWLDRWDQDGLPRLIRVRLEFPPNDPRHWPDIIASPMRETLP